jgi:hypothetical protein
MAISALRPVMLLPFSGGYRARLPAREARGELLAVATRSDREKPNQGVANRSILQTLVVEGWH